uniref:NADH-ubiquinone oxidoreductase chain 6 n=1 Tax=Cerynia lineola TaxID=2844954 RepID=A0A8H2SMY3_9HEMI|nr:NADH dehydrogenase subunit 6 [Cerynia lineola]
MIMKFLMLNSIITPTLKHPMSLGFMLMLQTILISMTSTNLSKSSWFSLILFITMIGGLMVMFMYMSSIASNEKFKFFTPTKMLMLISISMTLMIFSEELEITMNFYKTEMEKMSTNQMEEIKSTSKFFNLNKMNLTIIMMMTMFLTMVSVTKISSSLKGPLKKTYV